MRKLALLVTLGLFLSATAASACDGGKTCAKGSKTKSGCVCHASHAKGSKAMASKSKSSCTDPKCMKNGHCTKASSTPSIAPKATPEKS